MSQEHGSRRMVDTVERHYTTVLVTIITGAILFAANYFYADNREKGEDRAQLTVLTTQVIELRADFRSMQAILPRKEDLVKLENRTSELEQRIRQLERYSKP